MGVVLVSFVLRVLHIGQPELWLDEASTFYVATGNSFLDSMLRDENSPPLYFLLMRGWVSLAGTSEAALRLPSAVFGTLFVATVVWAGWTFFAPPVGLWAGGFAAIAPIHIYYSQEARPYSLLILLILLTYVLLWRALGRGTRTAWAQVVISAVLACHTHFFAILGLLSTALLLRFSPAKSPACQWPYYRSAVLICGLLTVPWYAWSRVLHSPAVTPTDWIQDAWVLTPPWLAIPKTLEVLGLGSQAGFVPALAKTLQFINFPIGLRLIGLGVLTLLGLWVACPCMDRQLEISELAKRKALLWGMLGVPLITLWLVSFARPVYVVARYDLIAFPAYSLLVGLAFAKLQAVRTVGSVLALAAGAALAMTLTVKLDRYYLAATHPSPAQISARQTAERLTNIVETGDVVVFTHLRGLPVIYYLHRLGFEWVAGVCHHPKLGKSFGCRMFPLETETHPSSFDARMVASSPEVVRDDIVRLTRELQGPGHSLWLAFGNARVRAGQFLAAQPDIYLIKELATMGFRWMPNDDLLFQTIVQMQR